MTLISAALSGRRLEVRVTGVVQGVGFRPHVHRLASSLGLSGFVGNDSTGVILQVEGRSEALDRFIQLLVDDAPPLAVIETLTMADQPTTGAPGFAIVESAHTGGPVTLVPPDVTVCTDCLHEMRDPANRRFEHPFITCTNCGPRFTIIRSLPYDRPNTTMAEFEMCAACSAEYHDPADRRYHAQPIGCHECGPKLTMTMAGVVTDGAGAVLGRARAALIDGSILAVKGIGGYHLVCDATSEAAVGELRRRKARGDKPFAVMVADLDTAGRLADINDLEVRQLTCPARPIVLVRGRSTSSLAAGVAPGNPLVGLMLPYTPLHSLLFQDPAMPRTLVMTSGNRSGEPIAYRDHDALVRLGEIADGFVTHDRPIHVPCDDSVVRVVGGGLQPIRRSRGFAPMPIKVPTGGTHLLAVGGELKNTFAVCADGHAWISQHIGDMENLDTLEAFEASVQQFLDLYRISPEAVVVDAHPAYLSSKWARVNHPDHVREVQHHHAHVGAVMAEHHLDPSADVIGVAFDGTGYGTDGAIWGGEILVANAARFDRVGHLRYVPLPGGDAAVQHPCRVALAHLWSAEVPWDDRLPSVAALSAVERRLLARQFETDFGCVPTSSMGRLFDAVSSLLDVRHTVSYEAQAAIELEIAAAPYLDDCPTYEFVINGEEIDARQLVRTIARDVLGGVEAGQVAAGFHRAVASAVAAICRRVRSNGGPQVVALTGGVFQNAVLAQLTDTALAIDGFDVLTHRMVPPNDGGLALGQAFIGSHCARANNGG